MLTPEEYEDYLNHCKEIEAAKAARLELEKRRREEAEAEKKRKRDEHRKWLKKHSPWEWMKEKRAEEEAERAEKVRQERAAERKRDGEERARIFQRGMTWAETFKTETLEDIADEILKVDADPGYILKLVSHAVDLRQIWIRRIIAARRRALGIEPGK